MFRFGKVFITFLLGISSADASVEVIIDGKKYGNQQNIELNADYHELLFVFPQDKNYDYHFRLENLEENWQVADNPTIRYTNLSGGEYVFYGKILHGNRIIEEGSISVHIQENFWEKWWFWIFLLFFITLTVFLVVYFWILYDFRQKMKVEMIRQRIAADLHDEVGANLNSITFFTEILRKKLKSKDKNNEFLLDKITSSSLESATLISDTIWALNPNFDTFEKLLERISSFGLGLLSSKDIAFSIDNKLNKDVDLPIEQRRNLYLILKEAINNIAKHSGAKKAFLVVGEVENGIKIRIEDNGVGFDKNLICGGNGLNNFRMRAKNEEIDLKIISNIGEGTKIEIFFDTKNH